ncbi:MAG: hypothetical protein ABIU10_04670, partial [Sphingomicrobium sp.]
RLVDLPEQARRVILFCDAYGLERRDSLLLNVEHRLQAMCSLLISRARSGDIAFKKMVEEGHLAHYERELAALRHHREELERLIAV